jgi:RNA polymerase primary sigma factor
MIWPSKRDAAPTPWHHMHIVSMCYSLSIGIRRAGKKLPCDTHIVARLHEHFSVPDRSRTAGMWSGFPSVQRTAARGSLPTASEIKSTAAGAANAIAAPATAEARAEFALVRAVVGGDAAAAKHFIASASAPLWSAVTRLEGGDADGEAAFLHVVATLKADGFARLKAFDGRARLSTFLALVARDILAERLAVRFKAAPQEVWPHFTRFFDSDIRRRVRQNFPRDASAQEDAYQDVCLKLVEDDFRRIRAYGGRGSFVGYVLTIVDRLLIDLVRREAPRRQLPTAIAKLPALEQAVYIATAWEGCPADARRLVAILRGRLERDPNANEIAKALARVTTAARPAARSRRLESVSLDAMIEDGAGAGLADAAPTPEHKLLLAEEERHRLALIAAVKAAATELPADERLYLQIVFSAAEPMPARDIAKLLERPVEEVYRLKQRAQRWLKEVAMRLNASHIT